jgi:peptidoglycan glycosyltransferase
MDRRIRILAVFLLGCFTLLFLQLNNLQLRQASSLLKSPDAPSQQPVVAWYDNPRGEILANDGMVLAESVDTPQGYLRRYPDGLLFADVTGYFDATVESETGLEEQYDGDLIEHQSSATDLRQILTEGTTIDSVVTTISPAVQETAEHALGSLTGAIVAIVPSKGAVVAMYFTPAFDPNGLSTLDAKAAASYYSSLKPNSGSSPLVNGVTQFRIAPGSTFKVLTTAAIFDHDPSVANIVWPKQSFIHLPQSDRTLQNYGGEACGGSLANALAVSCDTAYAQIGMDLGAQNIADEANAFGFNKVPPIDLPGAIAAYFPPGPSIANNKPVTAYSAIGQENVQETPLEDALVAAGIANGGQIMVPHLMSRVVSDTGQVVASYQPHVWLQATSQSTADTVLNLMLGVTRYGTAAGVFPASLDVAAKTGTAETGASGCSADWMIATGPAGTGQAPKIAVAAVLPAQPGISCSETGRALRSAGPRTDAGLTSGSEWTESRASARSSGGLMLRATSVGSKVTSSPDSSSTRAAASCASVATRTTG